MVAKAGAPYRSANAGELSEDAAGRADIKQFYSAGLAFKNIEPVPLSGFRDMPGSFDDGPVRGRMEALAKSSISATPGPHTGTQVIYEAVVSGAVAAIDCAALAASSGVHQVFAEVRRGGVWHAIGPVLDVGADAQALTFALPPGLAKQANRMRLQVIFSASASVTTGAVTVLAETEMQDEPRYGSMTHDDGARYFFSLGAGFLDIWKDQTFVAGVYMPDVTETILPRVNFYAENATIGVAHRNLKTQRVRRGGDDTRWVRDLWPYDGLPKVDLGGTYAKTDDVWVVSINWTGSGVFAYLTVTVDDETTPAISFVDATNTPVAIDAGTVDLAATAALIEAALEALPSLGPGVTVAIVAKPGLWKEMTITFGGALSGFEYQVIPAISNTANAAALASHLEIGETAYEPLLSTSQGWPGAFGFVQERLIYGDIKAVPAALAMSQAGEYFRLDLEISGPSAPRLDKLRGGQTSERVLGFAEAVYLLAFTNRGVYFASNRTITKTDPLNFVRVSDSGMVQCCEPAMLENKVFYVGVNADDENSDRRGHQLLSLSYSEIETSFEALPEHIFATHLVENVIRMKVQKAASRTDASKLWLLRSDGRLVAACVIRSQDVVGFCEWQLAQNGQAEEIHIDSLNALRVAVRRGGRLRHERLSRNTLLQAAIAATADLAGIVSGLEQMEGRTVWVEAQGYVEGPFTVAGGRITLDARYHGPVTVGLWQAPRWESMPRVLITRNDEVIKRPGRIHSATVHLMDATSVAVGANGQPVENLAVPSTVTAVDQPPSGFTGPLRRSGMLGSVTGTTLVVTQLRPGRLQVRDIVIEEKL